MDTLDSDLQSADPATPIRRDEVTTMIMTMTRELPHGSSERTRRRFNWRIAMPVGILATLAITGAAIAPQLIIWINGEEAALDARIPISYTTQSGITVDCAFGAAVQRDQGTAEDQERVAGYLDGNDWTGIGQEIYDYAIANPITSEHGSWTPDTPEIRDRLSLEMAIRNVILKHLTTDLGDADVSVATTDNCEGQLK